MPKPLVVTLEQKSYTWDGLRWYGTTDYMMPPLGTMHRLNAMIPKEEPVRKVKRATPPLS
jgi:hypothetical protein